MRHLAAVLHRLYSCMGCGEHGTLAADAGCDGGGGSGGDTARVMRADGVGCSWGGSWVACLETSNLAHIAVHHGLMQAVLRNGLVCFLLLWEAARLVCVRLTAHLQHRNSPTALTSRRNHVAVHRHHLCSRVR